jgi:serine/threonine protein kinase
MRGHVVDHRADLYALGAMAFEWLTGHLPITPEGDTLIDEFRHMLFTDPMRLRDQRPELSVSLDDLIATLLAKEPQRRPQHAAEAAQGFLQEAHGG